MNEPSRRDLFRQAGAVGAAAAMTGSQFVPSAEAVAQPQVTAIAPPQLEALESLTALEADTLQAVVARLIPADENGPGAAEAGAAHYIDRALSGPLRGSRDAYAAGLAALDAYALSNKGATLCQTFSRSAGRDADGLGKERSFRLLARCRDLLQSGQNAHDPRDVLRYYGGNANFIGWDLIGYPGIRMAVTADEQGTKAPQPIRNSAYADAMFTMKGGNHDHRP